MIHRKVVFYYAWSRPGEIDAPLPVIENRFPADASFTLDLKNFPIRRVSIRASRGFWITS